MLKPGYILPAGAEKATSSISQHQFRVAQILLISWQILLIVLYGTCVKVAFIDHGTDFNAHYQYFTGLEIMMLIGFGYLMTFLKRYGMGALGFTLLVTVLGVQWGAWVEWFIKKLFYESNFDHLQLTIGTVFAGLLVVTAVLISYGAVIGKVNPLQLVIMTIFECVFYSINKAILLEETEFLDPGGSIMIHLFGAYFGLAASFALGKPSTVTDNETNIVSDIFSFIGTLFLFIYWPSFNGGELPANSHAQQRAVVQTILSLSAGAVGAFVISSFCNPSARFRPVDIQNATLAGGVAIGTCCSLTLRPSDSMIIGLVAGCVSTLGYAHLTPWLESRIGLHDTCGIHNLHGIPGVIAAISSIILTAIKAQIGHDMPEVFLYKNQALRQLAALAITLAISLGGGFFTGLVMRQFGSMKVGDNYNYSDLPYWEVHPFVEPAKHDDKHDDKQNDKHGGNASSARGGRESPGADGFDDAVQEFQRDGKDGTSAKYR